jgi:hypothetical protein
MLQFFIGKCIYSMMTCTDNLLMKNYVGPSSFKDMEFFKLTIKGLHKTKCALVG